VNLRYSSLVIAVLSFLLPGAFAVYFTWSFERWAATQGTAACGMPLLGAWMLSTAAAALLSFVAITLGVVAFLQLPHPRPRARLIELGAIALPLLAAISLAALYVPAAQPR
jgi:hypothetical protein